MDKKSTSTTVTKIIESLFGPREVTLDFQPLLPLNECVEEVLEPLIKGLLYKNTYALLHGSKDTYKSWLAGYMACCIALGKPCFGFPVVQGKVVYVYGEGNMKKRLKRLCKALGVDNPTNIYPYYLRTDLSDEENMENLKKFIPPGTALIVIDNYEKFWCSDVDDEIVSAAMDFMREIREKTTVLLVQHDVKNARKNASGHQKSKGSSKIVNNADSTIDLTKNEYGSVTLGRYLREEEETSPMIFRLVDLPDDGIICELVTEVIMKSKSGTDRLNKIKEVLKMGLKEPMNKTSIYEKILKGKGIDSLSAKNFYKIVFDELIKDGFLVELTDKKEVYRLA